LFAAGHKRLCKAALHKLFHARKPIRLHVRASGERRVTCCLSREPQPQPQPQPHTATAIQSHSHSHSHTARLAPCLDVQKPVQVFVRANERYAHL
jgi:hypothetical protein